MLRVSAFCFSAFCALLIVFSPACAPYYWLGVKLLYDEVRVPESQIVRDVSYDPSAPGDSKRQLDLFLPQAHTSRAFPVVVFIHGGGWDNGDRGLRVGGADIYRNIGRMLASEGFGAAVISYRLIDKTIDWRIQAGDVARAVAWVQASMPERGATPRAVFLMGHSAGAQHAMRMAVEPQWLERTGGDPSTICGVIAVSGAGYDLEDPETQKLDTDASYYFRKFAAGPNDSTWRQDASPARWLDSNDPPFLLLYADDDYRSLIRQSRLVHRQMRSLGIAAELVVIPDSDHGNEVLKLSNPTGVAGKAILKFLRHARCPR